MTFKVSPTNNFLAIPTPPSTIKAPDVELVESKTLLRFTTPVTSRVLERVVASLTPKVPPIVVASVTSKVLPTNNFLAIPTPPATVKDPVVELEESVTSLTIATPVNVKLPVDVILLILVILRELSTISALLASIVPGVVST